MKNVALVATLALGILATSAWAKNAKPAELPQVAAAKKAVAEAVAAVAKDLASDNSVKREAAQKMLRELNESVMNSVLVQSKLTDPEQAQRVAALFEAIRDSGAMGKMLMSVPADERPALIELARKKPASFNDLFGEDESEVAGAVGDLASAKSGGEPIIRWALQKPQWVIRWAAISAATSAAKPSKKLVDMLFAHLQELKDENAPYMSRGDNYTQQYYSTLRQMEIYERKNVLKALAATKDDRVLAMLLKRYVGTGTMNNYDSYNQDEYMNMILDFKSKRTIVTLMDGINNEQQINSMNFNNRTVTSKRGDLAMYIIITQTGQDTDSYGFFNGKSMGYQNWIGFETDQARRKGREKLRDWFEKNKADYDNVEKVPVEGREKVNSGSRTDLPAFINGMGG